LLRTLLVIIHAASGIGGLITGLASLSPPRPGDGRGWWRRLYLLCIAILVGSMVVLVAIDWAELDAVARVAFGGLTVLGAVMAYRITRSHGEASAQGPGWEGRYIDHVAFTYISLWEGFIILPALNLPLPQVSVPVAAVGVFLAAHFLISRYKRRAIEPDRPDGGPAKPKGQRSAPTGSTSMTESRRP
jgi:hypothetical protein